MSARPAATISVDVDPVDLHLIGYGYRNQPADRLVYDVALPRLAQVFARCGVRATFFVVGRDAEPHAAALSALVRDGHEVASHSFSHPLAFASLGERGMREELMKAREALEAATTRTVVGYRSPNFDMDLTALRVLAECGYRYDASAYPSPMLLPARLLLALKSRDPAAVLGLKPWPFSLARLPSVFRFGDRALHEFPVSVTPWLRLPIYHTLRYSLNDARFESALEGFARRDEPLSYLLHAVDVLGLTEDRVDPRLARHPGMDRRLAAKLELLERSLRSIVQRFAIATFEERLPG
ncbi:MAG: polysaccharide deacetylase family protein [Candidatus Eisenbacteria bacterium]